MSTRQTLYHSNDGDHWGCHAYRDLLDDALSPCLNLYLELTGSRLYFETTPQGLTVRIPAVVWNRLVSAIGFMPDHIGAEDMAPENRPPNLP